MEIKNKHGGKRPGSGRKSRKLKEHQQSMLDVVLDVVDPDDWQTVVRTALSRAKAGDAKSRDWLTSWVMGAQPKPIEVSGPGGDAITVRVVRDRGPGLAPVRPAPDAGEGAE